MKSRKEVCDLIGVTRRTLQEYAKEGLLEPTAKTEAGYWMYDDEAIDKLKVITIFRRVGYKRNDIKEILKKSPDDLFKEFDKAIESLNNQKEEIEGFINFLKMSTSLMKMQEKGYDFSPYLKEKKLDEGKNFKQILDEAINTMKSFDGDIVSSELIYYFYIKIVELSKIREYEAANCIVQNKILDIYLYIYRAILEVLDEKELPSEGYELLNNAINNPKYILEMMGDILTVLKFEELRTSINIEFGEGMVEFIEDAIKYFIKTKGGSINGKL